MNYLPGHGGNGLGCFPSIPFLVGTMTDKTQGKIWRLWVFISVFLWIIFYYL